MSTTEERKAERDALDAEWRSKWKALNAEQRALVAKWDALDVERRALDEAQGKG